MEVTGPVKDFNIDDILYHLEEKLKFDIQDNPDDNYRHIIIRGEYPRHKLDLIETKYKQAGWAKAICMTSSENGERPGLTGLKLWAV